MDIYTEQKISELWLEYENELTQSCIDCLEKAKKDSEANRDIYVFNLYNCGELDYMPAFNTLSAHEEEFGEDENGYYSEKYNPSCHAYLDYHYANARCEEISRIFKQQSDYLYRMTDGFAAQRFEKGSDEYNLHKARYYGLYAELREVGIRVIKRLEKEFTKLNLSSDFTAFVVHLHDDDDLPEQSMKRTISSETLKRVFPEIE